MAFNKPINRYPLHTINSIHLTAAGPKKIQDEAPALNIIRQLYQQLKPIPITNHFSPISQCALREAKAADSVRHSVRSKITKTKSQSIVFRIKLLKANLHALYRDSGRDINLL